MSPLAISLVCLVLSPLARASEPEDSLLGPSFEEVVEATGLPVGWDAWRTPSAAAYSLADARTGVACVAVLDEDAEASYGLRSQPVKIEPGRTYQASAWVKILQVEDGGFAVYLEYWRGGRRVADYSSYLSEADDWTQVRVEHEAPPEAEAATVLVYASSATVGHGLFDDAALEEIEAPVP